MEHGMKSHPGQSAGSINTRAKCTPNVKYYPKPHPFSQFPHSIRNYIKPVYIDMYIHIYNRREISVITDSIAELKTELDRPWLADITPRVTGVIPVADEKESVDYEAHCVDKKWQRFMYAPKKKVLSDPQLLQQLKMARLVNAHADRRWLLTQFVAFLPHEMVL